jgi:hypothetical protein
MGLGINTRIARAVTRVSGLSGLRLVTEYQFRYSRLLAEY